MKPLTSRSAAVVVRSARSLYSVSVTALMASVTHAYDFGPVALLAGVATVTVLYLLRARFLQTAGWAPFAGYGLLSLWIIVGFGLVGGFWNHTVKVALVTVYRGMPAGHEGLFMSPEVGTVVLEGSGVLTFIACLFAAYFGYRFVRAALGPAPSPSTAALS